MLKKELTGVKVATARILEMKKKLRGLKEMKVLLPFFGNQ
jgi:hypothetical protein